MKKILVVLSLIAAIFSLASCAGQKEDNTIVVGTMQQPGEPLLKHIKTAFEEKGYTLKITLYTDFNLPNQALAEGSVDANLFQHEPFLNTYNSANGTNLAVAAKLYDCVYGGYTKKDIKSVNDIPAKSKISIASDASNMSRCLYILAAEGLITLDKTEGLVNLDNIVKNDKELNIVPMSTAAIASTLDDEDTYLGIVNATFAIAAGLAGKEMICSEQDPEHVNANILAVRSEDLDKKFVADLVEVLTSDDSKDFINTTWQGTIIPYFLNRLENK